MKKENEVETPANKTSSISFQFNENGMKLEPEERKENISKSEVPVDPRYTDVD